MIHLGKIHLKSGGIKMAEWCNQLDSCILATCYHLVIISIVIRLLLRFKFQNVATTKPAEAFTLSPAHIYVSLPAAD